MSLDASTLPYAAAIIAAAFGAFGIWLTQRQARRAMNSETAQKFIDQVQEERTADRLKAERERDNFEVQIERAFERIEKLEHSERVLLDYVASLRHHIDMRLDPPPPPFPPALRPAPPTT